MTIPCLATVDDLAAAAEALARIEPRFKSVLACHGYPSLRQAPQGLGPLLRIVTEQMISLKAAESIWARIEAKLDFEEPERIARMRIPTLMSLGLSGSKARCFKAVAAATLDGKCNLAAAAHMPDREAMAHLTQIPGIGPWTAQIYLLSNLGRADILPAGDIALQAAAADLFSLKSRPLPKALEALAEPWRPWRAVAARLLWSHYRGLKAMPQAN